MYKQIGKGYFSVPVTGCYHCGPDHSSPKKFGYSVTLDYEDDCLDERGFLLDNTSFAEYFTSMKILDMSCEQLARHSAHEFWETVVQQLGHVCNALEVRIRAFSNASHAAFVAYRKTRPQYNYTTQPFRNLGHASNFYYAEVAPLDCSVVLRSGYVVTFTWNGRFAQPVVIGHHTQLR